MLSIPNILKNGSAFIFLLFASGLLTQIICQRYITNKTKSILSGILLNNNDIKWGKRMSRPTEVAYQFIKQKIMDGTYKPSQKLIESELSELIGVSRNTIKKALLKLEQETLVSLEENKGATIKSFTLDEIINYLEVREVLEGLIARTAALNMSDARLAELEETVEKMKEHLEHNRFDEYSKCNHFFHNIIYEASSNQQAVDMVKKIKTQLQRLQLKTILVPGRTQDSFKEHQKILNALKAKDEKWAQDAVKYHVSHVRQTIVDNYSFLV